MRTFADIAYKKGERCCLDMYLPDSASFPVFVYFHGGGLTGGNRNEPDLRRMCKDLAARGVAAVSVGYRLYPNARYPDFLEDASAAVAWIFAHIGEYGSCEGVYVGGSSAGGYLSQMLCFDRRWLAAHGLSVTDIAGFVHDAGQPTCHFNVLKERGIDSRRVIIDDTAPLYYVGADAAYPPMLIIVSDNDMHNRYEQTMLLVSTLRHFGHADGVTLRVMHGGHIAYVHDTDENGNSILCKLVYDFINTNKK